MTKDTDCLDSNYSAFIWIQVKQEHPFRCKGTLDTIKALQPMMKTNLFGTKLWYLWNSRINSKNLHGTMLMNGKHARWIRSTKESDGASQASLVALFLCFFKNILKFSFLDGPRPWRPGPQLSAGTYFSGLTRISASWFAFGIGCPLWQWCSGPEDPCPGPWRRSNWVKCWYLDYKLES